MVKYLSGRQKLRPSDKLTEDRYKYLGLDQAEPNLADPATSPGVPSGLQYQLVAVTGYEGRRYWVPVGGSLQPGAITIFDEGTPVSSASSITQMNFVGAAVTAQVSLQSPSGHPGIAATVTVIPVNVGDSPPNNPTPNEGELWWESDTGDLYVYYNDGSSAQWVMANAGGRGLTGDKGEAGDKGVKGEVGLTGAQGAKGQKGEVGIGQKGEVGDKGQKGEIGAGTKGDKGAPGSDGSDGLDGDKGQKGELGTKGEPGSGGGGGASVTISDDAPSSPNNGDLWWESDTFDLHVYYQDGSSNQWVSITSNAALKGEKGETGAKGQKGEVGQKGDTGDKGQKGEIGPAGGSGGSGDKGQKGDKGVQGNFGGATFDYTFSDATGTPTDLNTGRLRLNNSTVSSADRIFIDDEDDNGTDIQPFLRTIDDSTSTIKGHVRISNKLNADDFALFTISSASEQSGFHQINVGYVSGSASSFTNGEDIIVTFARTGDQGQKGEPSTVAGAKGQKGEKGEIGDKGQKGQTGAAASKGQKGEVGDKGDKGDIGEKGQKGQKGEKGQKGQDGSTGLIDAPYGAVAAYSNSNQSTISYNESELALELQSSTDGTIGAAFPAFRVNLASNESHKLSIKYKASAASSTGFYVRVYEYDGALPDGKLVVSNSATNSLAQEDTRKKGSWKENAAITTDWQTTEFTYTPTSTATWTSIVVLNWSGMGSNSLFIRDPLYQLVGSSGSTGDKGQKGEVGATGSDGSDGDKGQKGQDGNDATGTKGQKGQKGQNGSGGSDGSDGDKGQKGEAGSGGSGGDKGQKGQKGQQGSGGSDGSDGSDGSKGQKGEVGSITAAIPSGGIIMWSGNSGNIPSGWYLCNGSNGTPDLRGRFVVCFDNNDGDFGVGDTGGSKNATLVSHSHTINNHTHTINNHTHSFNVTTGNNSHNHGLPTTTAGEDGPAGINWHGEYSTGGSEAHNTYSETHNHSVSGNTGNPSNRGTGNPSDRGTNSQGSSATDANLPPYYALCYIMKS